YRNKGTGHGAPAARAGDSFRPLADALLLAAAELFDRLDVLAGRQLVYVAEVRPVRGAWLVERFELVGEVPRRVASLELPRGAAPPDGDCVYLADPARPDDPAALVALHPLVLYDADAESVLFLNGRRGR